MLERNINISNIQEGDSSLNMRSILEEHLRDYLVHMGQINWLKIVDVQNRDHDTSQTRVSFVKMADRACHHAVIQMLDGKFYTFQDEERVLLEEHGVRIWTL